MQFIGKSQLRLAKYLTTIGGGGHFDLLQLSRVIELPSDLDQLVKVTLLLVGTRFTSWVNSSLVKYPRQQQIEYEIFVGLALKMPRSRLKSVINEKGEDFASSKVSTWSTILEGLTDQFAIQNLDGPSWKTVVQELQIIGGNVDTKILDQISNDPKSKVVDVLSLVQNAPSRMQEALAAYLVARSSKHHLQLWEL